MLDAWFSDTSLRRGRNSRILVGFHSHFQLVSKNHTSYILQPAEKSPLHLYHTTFIYIASVLIGIQVLIYTVAVGGCACCMCMTSSACIVISVQWHDLHLQPYSSCVYVISFFYVALLARAQKQQNAIVSGLRLDANLLGLLNGCDSLLTQTDYSAINAHIVGHNDQAAGSYFVNSVMFQLSPEVFESNVQPIIDAFESHGSTGSQHAATILRRIRQEHANRMSTVEAAPTMSS